MSSRTALSGCDWLRGVPIKTKPAQRPALLRGSASKRSVVPGGFRPFSLNSQEF